MGCPGHLITSWPIAECLVSIKAQKQNNRPKDVPQEYLSSQNHRACSKILGVSTVVHLQEPTKGSKHLYLSQTLQAALDLLVTWFKELKSVAEPCLVPGPTQNEQLFMYFSNWLDYHTQKRHMLPLKSKESHQA